VGDLHHAQPVVGLDLLPLGRLAGEEPCACGFTGTRILHSIEGRVDDMIWFRGVNVFPSAVEAVVRRFEELGHEYQIVIEGDRALPTMTIRVETRHSLEESERAALGGRVGEALHAAIRAHPRLEVLPPGTLPRAGDRGKARRVFDKRSN
jgi:phenylacetate-CoA ligase